MNKEKSLENTGINISDGFNPRSVRNIKTSKTKNSLLDLDWSNPFKGINGAAVKNAVVNAAGSAVGDIGGELLSEGMTSTAGNVLSGLRGVASAIPGPWGAVANAGLGLLSGFANKMVGSKMNTENIAKVESNINNLNNFQSNASDFDTLAQNWANADIGMTFSNDFIGKDGEFSSEVANKADDLRSQIQTGNTWVQNTLVNNAKNIETAQMQNLLGNYAAFGGELNTQGSDFTNGLLYINNGGSHETNPFEGVPMGVDPEGVPNLVEEGETIFNDYVFSNRLTVPKELRKKYKLGNRKDLTFAEASKKLARESEERPNDPISIRGLESFMADLANAQESLKNEEGRQFAQGGNLYAGGSTLRYNNGVLKENDPLYSIYKDYLTNGKIDFEKLYASDSPWSIRRNQVLELLKDSTKSEDFRQWYADNLNEYNKGRKGYTPYTADDITYDLVNKWSSDKKLGFGHNVIGSEDIDRFLTPRNKATRHYILGDATDSNGTPKDPYATAELIKDYDPESGLYTYVEQRNTSEGNTDYTNLYYRLKPKSTSTNTEDKDKNGTKFTNPEVEKLPTWFRYAPAVGLGISTLTDALGLTNKPDYSSADAVLDAANTAGLYQPVKFNPIGNYLTYRPFDRDYYINKMNAEAGATRRAITNTAGGNRATAMAGLLAADNNYLNQIGTLGRQADEYNFNQKAKVEEFNRGTNTTNSQGFLQADMANQNALANAKDQRLKGIMAAAEMRDRERLAADAAKSSNASNFLTSIGNIGRENVAWNWRNFGLATDTWGPVLEQLRPLLEQYNPPSKSKGGKLRKKKGLTI